MSIARKLMGVKSASLSPFFTFTDVVFSAADLSTYTFSGVDIGAPQGTRTLVLHVYALAAAGAGADPVSSITVNSVAATRIIGPVIPSALGRVYMYVIDLSGSSSATVVVTLTATVLRCAVGVYALYGYSSTPSATASNSNTNTSASAINANLTVTPDDAVLCSGQVNNSAGVTGILWGTSSGSLVEAYDFNPENRFVSAASMTAEFSGTLTVSMSPVGASTTIREMAVAAFSPL